jgi:hypothetical protein
MGAQPRPTYILFPGPCGEKICRKNATDSQNSFAEIAAKSRVAQRYYSLQIAGAQAKFIRERREAKKLKYIRQSGLSRLCSGGAIAWATRAVSRSRFAHVFAVTNAGQAPHLPKPTSQCPARNRDPRAEGFAARRSRRRAQAEHGHIPPSAAPAVPQCRPRPRASAAPPLR